MIDAAINNLRENQTQLDADGVMVGVSRQALEEALTALDRYKSAALGAGVCPTCIIQAPEPYGCSDCLNTGFVQGDPYERIKELEKQLNG